MVLGILFLVLGALFLCCFFSTFVIFLNVSCKLVLFTCIIQLSPPVSMNSVKNSVLYISLHTYSQFEYCCVLETCAASQIMHLHCAYYQQTSTYMCFISDSCLVIGFCCNEINLVEIVKTYLNCAIIFYEFKVLAKC